MKNMLSVLAGRSFRASKMRNLIAVLAIRLVWRRTKLWQI